MMDESAQLRWPSGRPWLLLPEALALLALAALAIAVLPFRRITAMASQAPAATPRSAPPELTERVCRAVRAAARRAPWRAKCFERGLATFWMLRRRGIAARLHYGIAAGSTAELAAHVWLSVDGVCLMGGETAAGFAEFDCFHREP